MNYDLDTEEGMNNAKKWTMALLSRLNDGGTWAVPRSGTLVRIDRASNTCRVVGLIPDPSIERVLLALGYTVINEQGEIHE